MGMLACLISLMMLIIQVKGVYKEGGPSAFYKGALPRAVKSALNIALQFFLYDSLKRLANVAPDDLKVRTDWRSNEARSKYLKYKVTVHTLTLVEGKCVDDSKPRMYHCTIR